MRTNPLKDLLKDGGCAAGVMIRSFVDAEAGMLLKHTGADFVLIDNEHTSMNLESLGMLCTVFRLAGVPPIVRIPDFGYSEIARRLDVGAMGLMVPRVRTRAEVEEVVACAKYPPEGQRGSATRGIFTDYGTTGSMAGDLKWINDDIFIAIQIETAEAMANLDDILSVPGVDATIMGPQDLSIALGVPGEHRHPKVLAAIDEMIAACNRHGVAPGIHTRSAEHLLEYRAKGMRLLPCSTDTEFMLEGIAGAMTMLKS
jgi:2-keto-3-deoxy-L-rhamnonate aldolase RhmA